MKTRFVPQDRKATQSPRSKPAAVRKQQHDRRDAPGHAEHGEDAAAAIVFQRVVGLACRVRESYVSCNGPSILQSSIPGAALPRAARARLGVLDTGPQQSRPSASDTMAIAADAGTMRGVSKPSGAGNAASTVTRAVVMASPMPPLKRRQKRSFNKKLRHDLAMGCAQRLTQADLAGAFGDRDQHDIDDADRAQRQRDHTDHAEETSPWRRRSC